MRGCVAQASAVSESNMDRTRDRKPDKLKWQRNGLNWMAKVCDANGER